jgi:hypothetical protein
MNGYLLRPPDEFALNGGQNVQIFVDSFERVFDCQPGLIHFLPLFAIE